MPSIRGILLALGHVGVCLAVGSPRIVTENANLGRVDTMQRRGTWSRGSSTAAGVRGIERGSWASGYGLHVARGDDNLNQPPLLPQLRMHDDGVYSDVRSSSGNTGSKSSKNAQGIIGTLMRKLEGRDARSSQDARGSQSLQTVKSFASISPEKLPEARSVTDVIADAFTVSTRGLDFSDRSMHGARGDDTVYVGGAKGRGRRGAQLVENGDGSEGRVGDEGVRENGGAERISNIPVPYVPDEKHKHHKDLPTYVEPPPPQPREKALPPEQTPEPIVIPLHVWAWISALLFVLIVWIIAIYMIRKHLDHYERPDLQKFIIRILFMAPIYSTVAFVSLTFPGTTYYITLFRDLLEAFVIFSFWWFLLEALGGERTFTKILSHKKQVPMLLPLTCLEPWSMGFEMFYNCKFGVMQFVGLLPVCAVATFVSAANGVYEADVWYSTDFWIALVVFCAALWAVYCFFMFYIAAEQELQVALRFPLGKVLAVLAVVFFCFFQGVLFRVALAISNLPASRMYSAHDLILSFELWLICLEMIIFALYVNLNFPVEEYGKDGEPLLKEDVPKTVPEGSFKTTSTFC